MQCRRYFAFHHNNNHQGDINPGRPAGPILALIVLAACMMMPQTGYGYFSGDDTGQSGANYLKVPIGSQAMGMGLAYTAVASGAASLWWNPSGMLNHDGREIMFESQSLHQEMLFHTIAYQEKLDQGNYLGIMANYLTWNKPLYGYDNLGQTIGIVDYTDAAFAVGYATDAFEVPFGLVVKGLYSKLYDTSAMGVAADIGLQQNFMKKDLTIGLSLKNIGPKFKYVEEGYDLPFTIQGGVAYRLLSQDLTLSAEVQAPYDQDVHFHFGVELKRAIGLELVFALRGGYHTDWKGYDNALNGLTAGLGIEWRAYQRVLARVGRMVGYQKQLVFALGLDYAWMPNDQLGDNHYLSLRLSF